MSLEVTMDREMRLHRRFEREELEKCREVMGLVIAIGMELCVRKTVGCERRITCFPGFTRGNSALRPEDSPPPGAVVNRMNHDVGMSATLIFLQFEGESIAPRLTLCTLAAHLGSLRTLR
jgi:hypothetical protein